MTAGQRNCYQALSHEVENYSLDDGLFAVRELVKEAGEDAKSGKSKYSKAVRHIERARQLIREAKGTP